MKKQLVSLLLCLCMAMAFVLIPHAVLADPANVVLDGSATGGTGWTWNQATRTLTLAGAELGNVTMTGSDPVTILVNADSAITGTLGAFDFQYMKYHIKGTKGAKLTIANIYGNNNDDIISVEDGVSVAVTGMGDWGASGGSDSYLTVSGTGSSYEVKDRAYFAHFTVEKGGLLTIHDSMTISSADNSLTIDKTSRIEFYNGLTIQSATPTKYANLLNYLPDGYFFQQVGSDIVLMEAVNVPATRVSVNYRPTYAVTVNHGTGAGNYRKDATVTLTADAPAEGMHFKKWTVSPAVTYTVGSATTAAAKFTMPAQAVTATATYAANMPTITQQPADQTVTVGQQATFTVAATGDELAYQWYVNRNDGQDWQMLNGQTTASYTTAATTLKNNKYQYRCDVIGVAQATAASNAAVLYVTAQPTPPHTGDSSMPLVWLCLALLGGIGLMLTLKKKQRA